MKTTTTKKRIFPSESREDSDGVSNGDSQTQQPENYLGYLLGSGRLKSEIDKLEEALSEQDYFGFQMSENSLKRIVIAAKLQLASMKNALLQGREKTASGLIRQRENIR